MKSLLHIFFAIVISMAATIPSGLVVCEKNGRISIEFESGEACSCDEVNKDRQEQFCCEDIECHENETVTSLCHQENQIKSNNCNDTKIEAFDPLKYFSNSVKIPVKTFKASDFFEFTELVNDVNYGLNTPMDVGKYLNLIAIPNQPLTIKKTTVFII